MELSINMTGAVEYQLLTSRMELETPSSSVVILVKMLAILSITLTA